MSDTDIFTDQQIIALTAWGEARSDGFNGMHAVTNVIKNRLDSGIQWWGNTLRTICLHPFQFSCWLSNDPNRPKLLSVTEDDPQYATAMSLATDALSGNLPDIVQGADSYYAKSMPRPPRWAENLLPVAQIGSQFFFITAHQSNPEGAFNDAPAV